VTLCAWLSVTACAAAPPPQQPSLATPVQDDAEAIASLRIGEPFTPSGSTTVVIVTDVSDDSRCPIDATCIWAGDATVTLRVQPPKGAAQTIAMHVGKAETRTATAAGLRLRLERLEPAPRAGQTINRDQYRVVIAIARQSIQEDR